jgi:adenine/guanine phosphoribosyltransferase-like PRPP-binding protein
VSAAEKPQLELPRLLERLARLELPPTDVVVGVATGGLVPAALVAYRLGCSLVTLHLNYRAPDHTPQHPAPALQAPFDGRGLEGRRVLLVDDVSVTGRTLAAARGLLPPCKVTTLVFKGRADAADLVLLPELTGCVRWPWNLIGPGMSAPHPGVSTALPPTPEET